MTLSEAPGAVKQFRKKAWRFQHTFATPLKNLRAFVTTIVSGQEFQGGCLTIDQVVFEPAHLIRLLASHSISTRFAHGTSISARSQAETAELLEAALGDWLDFIFTPVPKPIVLFADHHSPCYLTAKSYENIRLLTCAPTAH